MDTDIPLVSERGAYRHYDAPLLNLLILGDDSLWRYSVLEQLRRQNCSTQLFDMRYVMDVSSRNDPPDAILIDCNFTDEHHLHTCRRLSLMYATPIVVIGNTRDELVAADFFDSGADHYLVRPFRAVELVARIRAAIRARSEQLTSVAGENSSIIRFSDIEIDLTARKLKSRKTTISLSAGETGLFEVMVTEYPNPIDRNQGTRALFKRDWVSGDRTMDVTVSRLRSKLKRVSSSLDILTIRSVGYVLVDSHDHNPGKS